MTLNDAFYLLTVEQLEEALAADAQHGFPQDVFGLARFMLRTFSVLAPDCVALDGSCSRSVATDHAVEQRITEMVKLEQLRLDQLEKAGWSGDGLSGTRQ